MFAPLTRRFIAELIRTRDLYSIGVSPKSRRNVRLRTSGLVFSRCATIPKEIEASRDESISFFAARPSADGFEHRVTEMTLAFFNNSGLNPLSTTAFNFTPVATRGCEANPGSGEEYPNVNDMPGLIKNCTTENDGMNSKNSRSETTTRESST